MLHRAGRVRGDDNNGRFYGSKSQREQILQRRRMPLTTPRTLTNGRTCSRPCGRDAGAQHEGQTPLRAQERVGNIAITTTHRWMPGTTVRRHPPAKPVRGPPITAAACPASSLTSRARSRRSPAAGRLGANLCPRSEPALAVKPCRVDVPFAENRALLPLLPHPASGNMAEVRCSKPLRAVRVNDVRNSPPGLAEPFVDGN
ncbi:hypothetical protein AOQ84DRAFT_173967 [Glonium stellatum]|uniref:Uncharacterized protein n=1 Tax=Glonium stellatum TaxID=574774 RepID=A0A8E2F788_9PEZI|nr:hypothetical protein AOQ84DRAFT_173967 [Glonium stellatum]